MKLGRRRPVARGLRMRLGDYIQDTLPAPPPTCDYTGPATSVLSQVFLNDQLGCCVIAAGYHVIGLETFNAGAGFTATSEQILADYEAIGGYQPGHPNTDQGCDEETAMHYWTQAGFADGSKLAGFLHIDAQNQTEIQQAMFLFENLFFGVELPDAWINPYPSASGFTWDVGVPNIQNGHAFMGVGYNANGVQIDTWGMVGTITWPAVAQLCSGGSAGGQLFTLLTPDQVSKAQDKAPNGFDWPTLSSDFNSLVPRGGLTGK
jgi:hypothetical protein